MREGGNVRSGPAAGKLLGPHGRAPIPAGRFSMPGGRSELPSSCVDSGRADANCHASRQISSSPQRRSNNPTHPPSEYSMFGSIRTLRVPAQIVLAALMVAPALGAQNNAGSATVTQQGWNPQQVLRTESYVKPPAVIERIIMAPRVDISFTNPSPDRRWFIRTPGADRGDIQEYGKSHVNLGGLQIDTKANRARSVTTSTHTGIELVDPRTQATKKIETPKGATITAPTWSPSGTQIAYIASF